MTANLSSLSRNDKLALLEVLKEKSKRAYTYRYKTMFAGLYDWQQEFIKNTEERFFNPVNDRPGNVRLRAKQFHSSF